MKTLLRLMFISMFFLAGYAHAQQAGCDGDRYLNQVFEDFTVTTDVLYGHNTTIGGNEKDLFMDIYEPAGDEAAMRPAIVFVHGGGFRFGQRQDMAFICEIFALRGYVAATIDYRLIDDEEAVTDSFDLGDVVVKAASDHKAAIRFLREDAATSNNWRIDPGFIIGGGISAGAVTALHSAYLDPTDDIPDFVMDIIDSNGGFQGNSSDNTQYSSDVQAVLNYSGSITRDFWVGPNSAPLYSAHDELDFIVPFMYGNTIAFSFDAFSYGSFFVNQSAEANGVLNDLYVVENNIGHVSYFAAATIDEVIQESADLLYDALCLKVTAIASNTPPASSSKVLIYPNPSNSVINIELADENAVYDVKIYNIVGELVYDSRLRSSLLHIETSRFVSGVYFARILSQNSGPEPSIHKLVIQK